MTKVHMALLKPSNPEGMRRLIKWDKLRGVPEPNESRSSRRIFAEGMLCEIDAADLDEARSFCKVKILGTKEMQPASTKEAT